ncbi:MAG: efflux RND transporter periplasmic adaptor subunit [Planctomycetaceae bacterium]|nr:efflux RND transporter periplasmic adaptor subunit [Planctomycetaceae bacterium]
MLGALMLGWSVSGCGRADPTPSPSGAASENRAAKTPIRGDALEVRLTRWPLVVRSQGTLATDEVTVVGTKVAGRVQAVDVDLGDVVTPETELMVLDRRELELEVAQAEAALAQSRAAVGLAPDAPLESLNPLNSPPVREAQAVLDEAKLRRDRVEGLRKQRAVTEAEWEEVAAAEKVAHAQLSSAINGTNEKIALIRVRTAELALARQRLDEAVITAPYCGVVQQRHVSPGAFVQVGQAIVTLVRTDPLRFRGTLPERYARRLSVDQPVSLMVEALSDPIETKVSRISPALDPSSRALTFEAEIDNGDGLLRAGLFAEASVELDADRTAAIVPESAVTQFAGRENVWKIESGECTEQFIESGERRDGFVEVLAGLTAGDQVLLQAGLGKKAPIELQTVYSIRGDDLKLVAAAEAGRPEEDRIAGQETLEADSDAAESQAPAEGP